MIAADVDPNVVDNLIETIAKKVVNTKLETVAILMLESLKPVSRITSQLGRIFVVPWFGIFGYETMTKTDEYMTVFEDRENMGCLIERIQELSEDFQSSKKEKKKEI